jgi:hypothetical protein
MKGGMLMKKIIVFVLMCAIVFMVSSPVVFAADGEAWVYDRADHTNTKIERFIDIAVFRSETPGGQVDGASERITEQLVEKTDSEAEKLDSMAAKYDMTIGHDDTTVFIGGQPVLVDPCRVIGT